MCNISSTAREGQVCHKQHLLRIGTQAVLLIHRGGQVITMQLALITMQLASITMQLAAITMQLAAIMMQLAAITMQLSHSGHKAVTQRPLSCHTAATKLSHSGHKAATQR